MASISIEDFLKNVFMLSSSYGKASTGMMAKRLEVSNAAITDMSRKLAHKNLIHYEKYRGISLSEEGRVIALSVVRRHRLWELFLNKVLLVPWEKVHDEAEKLEHQTSDYLINEIDKFLDFPKVDPHGDPIPDHLGNIVEQEFPCLLDVAPPANMSLKRILGHTSIPIEFLNEIHCSLNQAFYLKSLDSDAHCVNLVLDGKEICMPFAVAENLLVQVD